MKSKAITCLIILFLFAVNFLGCQSSTKRTVPNLSIINPGYRLTETSIDANKARKLLSDLAKDNSLLATELGKLPELQDGITLAEMNALKRMVEAYYRNPERLDEVFIRMNKVGIPEVRKYCAPLQAMFWLAEKNHVQRIEHVLNFYSQNSTRPKAGLRILLTTAWDFSDKTKWGSPKEIMDRLNSPELFEFWLPHNFTYDWDKFLEYLYKSDGYPQSAEKTIETKKGICFDAAYVAYVCLKKAGYEATGLNVYFRYKSRSSALVHCVCVVKMTDPESEGRTEEKKFFVLADTNRLYGNAGPFASVSKAAEYVATLSGVTLKQYTTGLPSYESMFLR